MFPSSNSNNDVPLPCSNETLFRRSSFSSFENGDHANPNFSTQIESHPPFFSNFPSPFLDDHDFFLSHMMMPQPQLEQEPMPLGININSNNCWGAGAAGGLSELSEPTEKISSSSSTDKIAVPKKRRTGKKDRHSKISTAQGLRDRRMRLSLQIARKFFDLQDTLGFDKASRTIEWLFSKSKKAIKELAQMNNNTSSGDIDHSSLVSNYEAVESGTAETSNDEEESQKCTRSRKAACHSNPKQSRNKARARARERTREKMMNKCLGKPNPEVPEHQIEYLGNPKVLDYQLGYSSVPKFDELGEEYLNSWSQEKLNNHEVASSSHSLLNRQLANVEIIEKFVGTSSCSIFNYPKNGSLSSDLEFFGDCSISNNMVPSTGNNVFHEQNPSSIFTTTSNIIFPSQNQEN